MQRNPLYGMALGALAAAGLAGGNAHALTPGAAVDMSFRLSGASAQSGSLKTLIADEFCKQNPSAAERIDIYNTPSDGYWAVSCVLDGNAPGLASLGGNKVLFTKRNAGGSGWGVQPIETGTAIAHMDVLEAFNAGSCNSPTSLGTNKFERTCTLDRTNETSQTDPGDPDDGLVWAVADAGTSDVEPALFVPPNVPAGFLPFEGPIANVRASGGLVFGIPVTTNLRDALQAAQGLTVGAEDEANMPSLSRQQVATLFTAQMPNWEIMRVPGAGVGDMDGDGQPNTLVDVALNAGITTTADVGGKRRVHICRRVNGSGTQAQFNAKFLNKPCADEASGPAADSSDFEPTPALRTIVWENSGSGDLTDCLNDRFAEGRFAAGIQSLEKNADLGDDFRFVKIEGAAPTWENVIDGSYFDWAEVTMQWQTLNPDKTALIEAVVDNVATAATVTALAQTHPFGKSGFLALASSTANTPELDGSFNDANPVTPYSHAVAGSSSSTCRVPARWETGTNNLAVGQQDGENSGTP